MRVNVIGLGYIGLPTALSMAVGGNEVVGTDINMDVVNKISNGVTTFNEEGLTELLVQARESKNFRASNTCVEADVYVIAVPTPYLKLNKQLNPQYVISAIYDVLEVCPNNAIIAIESTISPGTIEKKIIPIIKEYENNKKKKICIAHVPERIIPGNMLHELKRNSRTIGVEDKVVGDILVELYSSFCDGKMIVTSIKIAEMTKVIENTYRDINIAFANELAKICHHANLNVYEVIEIANMHPRVNILSPGPGVGGHCISVDPWFLVGDYPNIVNIIRNARIINDSQPEYVLSRISDIMQKNGITSICEVGLYGLTYKENVDDIRNSPSLQLIDVMRKYALSGVKVYDPYIKDDIVENQYHNLDDFLNNIKMIVILVSHDQIISKIDSLERLVVFDTRNCISIDNKEIL